MDYIFQYILYFHTGLVHLENLHQHILKYITQEIRLGYHRRSHRRRLRRRLRRRRHRRRRLRFRLQILCARRRRRRVDAARRSENRERRRRRGQRLGRRLTVGAFTIRGVGDARGGGEVGAEQRDERRLLCRHVDHE